MATMDAQGKWHDDMGQYTESPIAYSIEDQKAFQLQQSQLQGQMASQQQAISNKPIDLRGRVDSKRIREYTARAQREGQSMYDKTAIDIRDGKLVITDADIEDPNVLKRIAYDEVHKYHEDTKLHPILCYHVAGSMGAMLDSKGKSYECINGFAAEKAYSSSIAYTVTDPTHTWIEYNNKVYERSKNDGKLYTFNKLSDLVFDKRR